MRTSIPMEIVRPMNKKTLGRLLLVLFLLAGCRQIGEISPVTRTEIPRTGTADLEDWDLSDIEQNTEGPVSWTVFAGTDRLRKVEGCYTPVNIQNEEDALRSLHSVRSLYGITDFSFFCRKAEERKFGRFFELGQLYKGLCVVGGYFRITAGPEGRALSVEGFYKPIPELNTVPGTSLHQCMESQGLRSGMIRETELCIAGEDPILCWRILTEDTEYYFDAVTGNLMRTEVVRIP